MDLIVGVPTASDARMTVEQRPRQEQRKTGSTDDPVGMISGKFETDIEVVDEAFEVEDGVPRLTIARGKLASSKKAAT